MFEGKKTYILAVLIAVATGVKALGWIDESLYQTIVALLGAAGLSTVRQSIATVNKKLILVFALLLFPSISYAQTPVVQMSWDYDKASTEVATFAQVITVDGTVLTALPTCVAQGSAKTICTIPAPTLATGSHNVSISASKNGITAETRINGLNVATNAPPNPGNPRATVTVTIVIGS